jgi:hypothetical protein
MPTVPDITDPGVDGKKLLGGGATVWRVSRHGNWKSKMGDER